MSIAATRVERIHLAGESSWEELALFERLMSEQQALLDGLAALPERDARAVFAALGIREPNRYADAREAFGSFRSCAFTSEGSPILTYRLTLAADSGAPDFVYVHLADDVIPVGFLACTLDDGGVLGYYRDLREALDLS